jgi:hypothetical protein
MSANPLLPVGVADVYLLPVHPWAARFPMRSDDDLASMAESVKANGLRLPIVLGMAIPEGKEKPTLCIIDGRNRREACRIAGVVDPPTIMLNGEDQDAYIVDANLERRDLSKGQKAMLLAVRFPKGQQGKKGTSPVSDEVSSTRIKAARLVNELCPEMVEAIIAGGPTGLDEAYAEAQRRKALKGANETRFDALQAQAPDLADLVREERMKLSEAEAAQRDREEKAQAERRNSVRIMDGIDKHIHYLDGVFLQQAVANYRNFPDDFSFDDLRVEVDEWIQILQRLREGLS